MTAMDVVQQLILERVIEVRPDGTIWKLRNLNAMSLPAPRRLETRSKRGYLAIRVSANRRAYMVAAHRVVWVALRGAIPAGMDINHIDGVRTNNHPTNLELATRSENHLHAYRVLGRKAPRNILPRVLETIATQAKELRAAGLTYKAIGEKLGVSQTTAFRATRAK